MTKIAVTGHRLNKLGYDDFAFHAKIKKHMLSILDQYEDPILISGCALGIDQFWMEVGLNNKLPVIAAIPFYGFDQVWPIEARQDLAKMLECCTELNYICNKSSRQAFQKRNEWMVDNADLVVAYWDGSSGGTANCVRYAWSKKKEVLRFDPKSV